MSEMISSQRVDMVTDLILAEEAALRRLARRLTRCDSDADDLVQDALLRAYRARERFEPGTSVRAWTSTILRRVFLTHALQSRRRRCDTDTDAGQPLERAAGGLPSATEGELSFPRIAEWLEGSLKRAIERVPSTYRIPFLLAAIEGMSCRDIAQRLGVPEGTVMSRIHRARQRIKEDLVYAGSSRRERGARPALRLMRQQSLRPAATYAELVASA